ncbi:hypothetical protein Ctha_0992 [Chloroherpeton thalassium ATCC 35110]|uniref:Formylmethanofuran dehydrogenase subunit E domain-containing protein n=1 Tax=Chloroherpeton thalassium (strain ATCC 35110 / GB-78) TaxID=517418 RepID=B3QXI3_CHLT3|nr:FmdE family protein [Chloroherpeton thalassium]ACF13457.1 hypothetical protein Ctha_0992 [Chloroherpeton thalassium ATCC 35110]
MNLKLYLLASFIILFITGCSNEKPSPPPLSQNEAKENSLYHQAGIIKLQDSLAAAFGYKKAGEDFFEFTLDDVGKYTGHICPGITSGFLMTKQALAALYPNDEMPQRGNVSVVSSSLTDHLAVASYILRDEPCQKQHAACVDKSLQGEKGTLTMIFKRNDTGKMVRVVFNRAKLMTPEKMGTIRPLKEKVLNGKASDEERKLFAESVQSVVKTAITAMPEGVITLSEITDYKFPEAK